MANYGSWTTIDCPTKQREEALSFLREEFSKIEGKVRMINNLHDLGSYPSFEIDKPEKFDDIDMLEDEWELCNEDEKLLEEWDNWQDKANEIEEKYNEKFNNYL